MSEPLQLVGRIFIAAEQLSLFRSRPIAPADRYDDWQHWLSGKQWHGSVPYESIVNAATAGVGFDAWFKQFFVRGPFGSWYAPVLDSYDGGGCWEFAVFGFSENYGDFVTAVNALRQLDCAGGQVEGQFAIVPFAFGPGFASVEVVCTVKGGGSSLDRPAASDFVSWAQQWLEEAGSSEQDWTKKGTDLFVEPQAERK